MNWCIQFAICDRTQLSCAGFILSSAATAYDSAAQTGHFTSIMKTKSPKYTLILASGSPYRKSLLQRLGLQFSCIAPAIDETAGHSESAPDLTRRLAHGKALCVARLHPGALVIGSDQVADFEGRIVGKPHSVDAALSQLLSFSGKSIQFISAICVLRQEADFCKEVIVPSWVHFREFSAAEAQRYIELDMPLDCAGSFKSEAGGSVLLRGLESTDPTALIGLPLIALSSILRAAGMQLP